MRHLHAWLIVIALLFPSAAQAHGHVWDFAFGPAWAEGSSLWGGHVSIGLTNKVPANKNLSWLIDLTNLKDRESSQDTTQLAYYVGPRYSVGENHHTAMVHGQLGIVDKHQGATGTTQFAMKIGAAYEWVPKGNLGGLALRVQAEHSFVPDEDRKGYTQISASFVRRFN